MFTKTLAAAMIVASATAQVTPADIETFATNLLQEWIDDNQLTQIEGCEPTLKTDLPAVEAIIKDLESKDIPSAVSALKDLVAQIPGQISQCGPITDDAQALIAWGKAFESVDHLKEVVKDNIQHHLIKVTEKAHAVLSDYKAQEFDKMGKDAADLINIALGPVHGSSVELAGESNDDFPTELIVNTMAGVLYGWVKANDLPGFKQCYQGAKPLYKDLSGAVMAVKGGNPSDAVPLLKDMVSQMPGEIQTCQSVDGDVAKIVAWGKTLDEATLLKNLMANMAAIKDDVNQAEAAWGTQSYFHSGVILSDILAKVLGPVTAPEVEAEPFLIIEEIMFLN